MQCMIFAKHCKSKGGKKAPPLIHFAEILVNRFRFVNQNVRYTAPSSFIHNFVGYLVSEVLRGAYLHRMENYCACEM